MCGRFALYNVEGLSDVFGVYNPLPPINLSYNISPGVSVPVICGYEAKKAVIAGWGISPSWARGDSSAGAGGRLIINIRSESLGKKRIFQENFEKHRCLVPANGFYEWKKTGKGKQPYYIKTTDQPLFAFAGICFPEGFFSGDKMPAFGIITTDANSRITGIHERMPAILEREKVSIWMTDGLDPGDYLSCLFPYPEEKTVCDAVSHSVNSAAADGPSLIRPASENPWWQF